MQSKIPKSYKFNASTVDLIERMLDYPQYASATHLIELLVYQEAQRLGIVAEGNGDLNGGDDDVNDIDFDLPDRLREKEPA